MRNLAARRARVSGRDSCHVTRKLAGKWMSVARAAGAVVGVDVDFGRRTTGVSVRLRRLVVVVKRSWLDEGRSEAAGADRRNEDSWNFKWSVFMAGFGA